MIFLFKKLHYFYSIFIILFFAVLFYPMYYVSSRKPEWWGFLNRLRRLNSWICSLLMGVWFRFRFEEALDKSRTYIYCANHSSNLDIMVLCILARGRFHFMGKDALLKNPVLGIFFKTIDIPVNRESKISAFRAFKRAGDNLEQGMSLIIFPEGKINDEHYPPVLGEFKNGPFRLAIEKNITIVPISLVNVWKRMWDDGHKYGTTPGICDIYIHKPVSTESLAIKDADQLKDHIYDIMNSKLVIR